MQPLEGEMIRATLRLEIDFSVKHHSLRLVCLLLLLMANVETTIIVLIDEFFAMNRLDNSVGVRAYTTTVGWPLTTQAGLHPTTRLPHLEHFFFSKLPASNSCSRSKKVRVDACGRNRQYV